MHLITACFAPVTCNLSLIRKPASLPGLSTLVYEKRACSACMHMTPPPSVPLTSCILFQCKIDVCFLLGPM